MWKCAWFTNVTKPSTVFLGLGGNVGDVKSAMQWALGQISNVPVTRISAVSPLYKTPPWGIKTQNWFLNACVALSTTAKPHAFMRELIDVEKRAGRVRDMRWGPRTLDIDILTFEDLSVKTPQLTLPHPRMLDRAFVMTPLADIAGDLIINGASVRDISVRLADHHMEIAARDWMRQVS
ncbi:MAG: 2-amino-4-hydroxy-6-hydroxymethyldihydropteridine diphosphokinase [Pseudomonadota bacterium]